ncbi:hypothetical protein pb186bvf_020505 [Paramecium bursaria]
MLVNQFNLCKTKSDISQFLIHQKGTKLQVERKRIIVIYDIYYLHIRVDRKIINIQFLNLWLEKDTLKQRMRNDYYNLQALLQSQNLSAYEKCIVNIKKLKEHLKKQ